MGGAQINVGGQAPSEICSGPLPHMPVTRQSAVDIDQTLDAFFPAGPRLADATTVADSGYTRDLSVSFARALLGVARERAKAASTGAASLERCADDEDGAATCLQQWLRDWGAKLYRRPLEPEQLQAYAIQFESVSVASSAQDAAESTLSSMIMSPYFVLRIELGQRAQPQLLTQYEVAARLSHFAARRAPDADLLASAAAGTLSTPGEILQQMYRLWSLPEGRTARALQHLEWLGLEKRGPAGFDAELGADMDAQARSLVSEVFEHQTGTLLELLTSARQAITPALALHYGLPALVEPAEGADLSATAYSGLLSTGAFLTRYPRPTLRGQQILGKLLCQPLISPHDAGPPPTLVDGPTPRERITLSVGQNAEPSCAGCHRNVDPTGFALEAFDDQGRLSGLDSTGSVVLQAGSAAVAVAGPRALGTAIAQSGTGVSCAAQHYLEYALDRSIGDTIQVKIVVPQPEPDPNWQTCLAGVLGARNGSLTQLAEVIATSALMRQRSDTSRYVIAFDTSPDPVDHAYEETRQFRGVFSQSDDETTVQRYLESLQQLRVEGPGGPIASAGAGGDAAGGDAAGGATAGGGAGGDANGGAR
jgi:uncharacterized protein DUF1592/uncharacterized protein DUF1588/uncharacterized protein DUF1595